MIHELRYVNSKGDEITFGGDHAKWRFGETDIFDMSLSYTSIAGRITSFLPGIRTASLRVFIRNGNLEDRNRLEDIFAYDTKMVTPGTLYAGGSYLKCYRQGVKPIDWHYFDGMYTADLSFVIEADSLWIRKVSYTLYQQIGERTGGLDYPHDYPHDYSYSAGTSTVITNPFEYPAKCNITFPGPCVDPYVIIGNNRYQVKGSAEKGQLILVQGFGRKKEIILRSSDGTERSIFSQGVREENARIFEQIPNGDNVASWAGVFNIEVDLFEERYSPWWT